MKSNEQILEEMPDSTEASILKALKKAQIEIIDDLLNYDDDEDGESIYDYLYTLRNKVRNL